MESAALSILAICGALLAQTYGGYLVSLLIAKRFAKPFQVAPRTGFPTPPKVSICFSVYNEAASLREKLDNCLSQQYPKGLLEVYVASDESSDGSDEILREYESRGVRWFRQSPRRGKNAALNRMAPELTGEVWIFTDANTFFAPDAVARLAENFDDPRVGMVCGDLAFTGKRNEEQAGAESIYWNYDKSMKRAESYFGRMMGANGGIFAIRRERWVKLDPAATPDFYLPAMIAAQGAATLYEPRAKAREEAPGKIGKEFRRRVRIILRGLYGLSLVWGPAWRNRRWFLIYSMISRKWLRRLQPVLLLGLFMASGALVTWTPAALFFAAQCLFYAGCGLSGVLYRLGIGGKWGAAPFYFLSMNAAALVALIRFAAGQRIDSWSLQRADEEDAP